ncbi:cysteine-rich and transmembrane domain-containing protein WIH1-like [Tripterygium wilfordii]|uniref:cysteine-rich and transmembrane domain-containing protein WIH1-like n=1 Tax=Tripterygium wilfordii TaxID=458696 RepID=UPI0018F80E64|nr:cysteine-rich and transmembrane domain-containing protein WIH1-like [Tripterygium wilfordii]
MSQYKQNQHSAEAYPAPPPSTAPTYVAPPPAGYPMKGGTGNPQNHAPIKTKTRGDGFWKGCCAALCCCCMLDACF